MKKEKTIYIRAESVKQKTNDREKKLKGVFEKTDEEKRVKIQIIHIRDVKGLTSQWMLRH